MFKKVLKVLKKSWLGASFQCKIAINWQKAEMQKSRTVLGLKYLKEGLIYG